MLAFTSNRTGSSELWTVQADGSGARQLTRLGHAVDPWWSPDGRHIVFERQGQGIWIISRDGRGLRRVVASARATFPRWDADASLQGGAFLDQSGSPMGPVTPEPNLTMRSPAVRGIPPPSGRPGCLDLEQLEQSSCQYGAAFDFHLWAIRFAPLILDGGWATRPIGQRGR